MRYNLFDVILVYTTIIINNMGIESIVFTQCDESNNTNTVIKIEVFDSNKVFVNNNVFQNFKKLVKPKTQNKMPYNLKHKTSFYKQN